MKIPFFKPEIDSKTIAQVGQVIKNGWLTTGPKTLEFETNFAQYVNATHAIMVNSGTAALHLALEAIDIKPGDEVITTPFTFAATTEVIEYMGAKPIFVDIRKDTLNINEKLIEAQITSKTRAIIPVHFSGIPCEMKEILKIARKHKLYVIEDAAHCTPAYYNGKPVGSIGHITCFSFYANKCITTAEGGMLTTQSKKIADKVKLLRLHGMSRDAINRYKSAKWEYDISVKGFKYNPTDIAACLGIMQLKKADLFLKKRTRIASNYMNSFSKEKNITSLSIPNKCISSWYIYPIRIKHDKPGLRNQLIDYLFQQGISTSVHFKPVHLHSYYKNKYGYKALDFPVAYYEYQKIITLPVYPSLKNNEIDYISRKIKKFLAGV